jgi:hypothetical protein
VARETLFSWISIYSCLSSCTWIPHVSDFISSPHFPFKSLIRLLLLYTRAGRLSYSAPGRYGSHRLHARGQSSPAHHTEAVIRVGSSARRAEAVFGFPRGGRRQSSAPRAGGDCGHRLPARRAASIGSLRGGLWAAAEAGPCFGVAACVSLGGLLWVLRNDRNFEW